MGSSEGEEAATTRWLVQFGYDGAGFSGWARQPGRRTVEGTILEASTGLGIAPTATAAQLEVASRTDRGVHARANALALTSQLPGPALLRALNGIDGAIFFSAARSVHVGFSVRTAASRWYRYFEPARGRDTARWRRAAALYRGPVDVRSFGRDIPAGTPVWRDLTRVSVVRHGGLLTIDLRAPSFVWGMVRKIVASLRAYDRGTLTLREVRQAIAGRRRLTLPLAEPERLVLWEVTYDEDWEYTATSEDRPYRRAALQARDDASVRASILDGLWPRAPPSRARRRRG